MKGLRILFVGAAVAAMTSACNGGAADNVASCEAYVTQINELDCYAGIEIDPETTCSGYESTTCDISDYFDCLTENTVCTEAGAPDTSGQATCVELASCD